MALYRSHHVDQAVVEARATVDDHRLDPATTRCRACQTTAPCAAANQAVNLLAAMGALDTTADCARDSSGGRLLTHGWRVMLGLTARPPAASAPMWPRVRRP
jgi:hypothetical protein